MNRNKEGKIRYNIAIAFVYIIGIILLVRLFNLQIVHGAEYREQSNTRLTRETELKAARGNVMDSSGNKLVSTTIEYNVEIYKTKINNETLNNTLLEFAKTMESNGDSYVDNFPITLDPVAFKAGMDFDNWKKLIKLMKMQLWKIVLIFSIVDIN